MSARSNISIIAPEPIVDAFSVLIDSMPHAHLLASAADLDELIAILGEKKPDVILVYLVQESGTDEGQTAYEIIARIKIAWPEAVCLAIIRYPSQLEKAKESGADLALLDGVSGERLLAAIEEKMA